MNIPVTTRVQAQDLLDFIDASPSPWHAVHTCEARLAAAGFSRLDEADRWSLATGDRCYVVRGGSSIIAFIVGSQPVATTGLRMIGAHTDSPGLRLKPKPAEDAAFAPSMPSASHSTETSSRFPLETKDPRFKHLRCDHSGGEQLR